jgi:arsenate reductase
MGIKMQEIVQVWHNSRCSKSRNAVQWMFEKEIENESLDYLKFPISKEELSSVLNKLSISAFDLIRKNEKVFVENWKNKNKTEAEWIEIMIQNPQLIERPIVIKGERAIIARPLEMIEQLFK